MEAGTLFTDLVKHARGTQKPCTDESTGIRTNKFKTNNTGGYETAMGSEKWFTVAQSWWATPS